MASTPDQLDLIKEPQINPDFAIDDDFGDAYAPDSNQKLRLGFLKLDGLKHVLKLRTRQQLRTNVFADLGTDFHLQGKQLVPRASLEYRVHNKSNKHLATLRVDRRALYLQKHFPVNLFDKVTARFQATAATTYQGVPEVHFGFEQVRPPWLMAVGAVALLASGKTVSGGRTFGRTNLHVPKTHQDTTAQGEVNASVKKRGNGLVLALNQLNAFLRL
jgi:hypothetical protein